MAEIVEQAFHDNEEDQYEFEGKYQDFYEELKKLPGKEALWSHGEVSWCGMKEQGGGALGWHWKTQGSWKGYDPSEQDLDLLKKILKKFGFYCEEEIDGGIYAYEG